MGNCSTCKHYRPRMDSPPNSPVKEGSCYGVQTQGFPATVERGVRMWVDANFGCNQHEEVRKLFGMRLEVDSGMPRNTIAIKVDENARAYVLIGDAGDAKGFEDFFTQAMRPKGPMRDELKLMGGSVTNLSPQVAKHLVERSKEAYGKENEHEVEIEIVKLLQMAYNEGRAAGLARSTDLPF